MAIAIAPWTLSELAERAARALGDVDVANGQVREVPDARTIRWYQTIGLVDRPAAFRGRTALYALRHLAQLVAIKRLQAQGTALREVQARLLGLDDDALLRIAALPDAVVAHGTVDAPSSDASSVPPTRRDGAFWHARGASAGSAPADDGADDARDDVDAHASGSSSLRVAVDRGDLTLVFTPARPVRTEDREAIERALADLERALQARGLVAPAKGDMR